MRAVVVTVTVVLDSRELLSSSLVRFFVVVLLSSTRLRFLGASKYGDRRAISFRITNHNSKIHKTQKVSFLLSAGDSFISTLSRRQTQ